MGIKEQIYNRSPLFLQHLFTTLYGYQLHRERYGPVYQERLQMLLKREHLTIDVKAEQLDRLNDFLHFCAEHSPYYQHLFLSKGIRLPLKDLSELKKIPVLSKETLRTRMEEIRTDIAAPIIGKTGGTTGMSLQVCYIVPDMQIRMAHLDYFKATHGVRRGMRRVSFTAQDLVPERQQTDVYWRMNRAANQLLFTVKRLSPRTMAAYLEAIEHFQPETIDGLPSAMIELARFAKREGIRLTCQPIAIFPTAERIDTEERQVIEDVFHGPVFDQYASSEGAPIVSVCRFGQKHLHHEMGIIELDVDGEILVTSFDTHGTPLIRYRVGDRMTLSQRTCSCGHRRNVAPLDKNKVKSGKGGVLMKPQILLMGMFHLDRPANGDMIRPTIFDVTSERRQREIKQVVTRLNTFRPTCVALETAPERMGDVQHTYETYQHESDLTDNERQQIGFRLARMAGLAHLHGVDWNESVSDVPDLGEIRALHPEEFATVIATETKRTHQLEQAMEQLPFSDWLDLLHNEKTITASATVYKEIERLENGRIWIENYWHVRNQKIATRLLQLAQTTERIVCLYGAAHLPLLRQYLNESNQVEVMTWNDWNNEKECM